MRYNAKIMEHVDKMDSLNQKRKRLMDQIEQIDTQLFNVKRWLGHVLCPADADRFHIFNVWVGDRILEISPLGEENYRINWRANGRQYIWEGTDALGDN